MPTSADTVVDFLLTLRRCDGVTAMRRARKRLTAALRQAKPLEVRTVGLEVVSAGYKWLGYELLAERTDVLKSLGAAQIEALGEHLDDWGSIDAYGVLLAGPAWRAGVLADRDIRRWTASDNHWRRRAALVATVAWNTKSRGGGGDSRRTLAVCRRLVADREDMVIKALSWALRALVAWDAPAVQAFLAEHDEVLAARVKREVRNKLRTGVKSGKSKSPAKA